MLLGIAFGPAVIAACFALLMPHGGSAYNTYVNEYLKWPWRAGSWHYVSGGCGLGGIVKNSCLSA
jgi:hypothetical protein